MHRFFDDLSKIGMKRAVRFANSAGKLPRMDIIKGVKHFEEEAKYTNYAEIR